jgi:hypothetical protein
VPPEDLPVLTKNGVGCSLAEYQRQLRQLKSHQLQSSRQRARDAGPSTDVPPPPYVEDLQEDPAAKKSPIVTMDHQVLQSRAGRNDTGECLFGSAHASCLMAIGSSNPAEQSNAAMNANLLQPVLAQLLASRARSFPSRSATPSPRPSTPVPRVH